MSFQKPTQVGWMTNQSRGGKTGPESSPGSSTWVITGCGGNPSTEAAFREQTFNHSVTPPSYLPAQQPSPLFFFFFFFAVRAGKCPWEQLLPAFNHNVTLTLTPSIILHSTCRPSAMSGWPIRAVHADLAIVIGSGMVT